MKCESKCKQLIANVWCWLLDGIVFLVEYWLFILGAVIFVWLAVTAATKGWWA